MFKNPLCGYSLRRGSRMVAVIDLVIGFCVTIFMLNQLVTGYSDNGDSRKDVESGSGAQNGTETEPNVSKSVSKYIIKKWDRIILIAIYMGAECWLFTKLLKATRELDLVACRTWVSFRSLLVFVSCIFFLFNVITGKYETVELVLQILRLLYMMYAVDIVVAFRKEIEDVEQGDEEEPKQGDTTGKPED